MRQIPLIRFQQLDPIIGFLREHGAPIEKLLRRSGLSELGLEQPDHFVPAHRLHEFLQIAASREGVEDLGSRCAAERTALDHDWIAAAFEDAPTLQSALTKISQALAADSSLARFWLARPPGDYAWFCYKGSVPPGVSGFEIDEQFAAVLMVQIMRVVAGDAWTPKTLDLRSATTIGLETLEYFHSTDLRPQQGLLRIEVPKKLLARQRHPVSLSSKSTLSERSFPALDFGGSICQVIHPYLRTGLPKIQVVAEYVGMTTRTLQRRLAESGLSYSQLTDRLRRELVLRMLAVEDAKFIDIAHAIGMDDPAHFTRTFRRWTGITPREYRSSRSEV